MLSKAFNKLSLFVLLAPLVAALQLNAPSNPTTDGQVTINWTFDPSDPPFSLFLTNEAFNDSFGIANNVQPALGTLTLTLPSVPVRGGYTLKAVNIGNINQVYSQTGQFSVGANTAAASSSSTSNAVSTTSATGSSGTATSPASATTRVTTTTSAFGTTITSSGTSTIVSTSTGSGSGSSSAASASNTSNAATPLRMNTNVGAMAAVVFSAVAGAAILVL